MITYFTDGGALMHRDDAKTIEDAKKVLEEKKLCVAVIDNDGEPLRCVTRGTYKEMFLLYNGKAFMV